MTPAVCTPAAAPLDGAAVRGAIVDLDGTLVDTLGDFESALSATLGDLGLSPLPRAFVAKTIGKGSEHLIRRTLEAAGADGGLYEHAWALYQANYAKVNGLHAPVFPGVAEGLARWRAAGVRLACVTNKPTRFARELLRRKGLEDHFEFTFGGDAFERRKPDPLPLLKACEALGLPSAEVVMVGDSANDAQAARAAGCRVVLVRYGYNHGEPIDAVPAHVHVDRLDELDLAALGPSA